MSPQPPTAAHLSALLGLLGVLAAGLALVGALSIPMAGVALVLLAGAGIVGFIARRPPDSATPDNERIGLILDSVPNGVIVLDGDRRTLFINAAAAALFAASQAEAAGQPPDFGGSSYVDARGRALALDDLLRVRSLSGEDIHELVIGVERAGLDRIWVSISTRAVTDQPMPDEPALVLTAYDVTERHEAEIASEAETVQLRHRALHDSLTGLPNRTLLMDRLAHAKQNSGRRGAGTGLIVIDLDGFKAVNDNLGHAAGDEVLVQVAVRLRTTLRASDTAARLGGDEFVILCEDLHPGMADLELVRIADRIQSLLDEPYITSAGPADIGASLGWAVANPGEELDVELVGSADEAMLADKRRRKTERGSSPPAAAATSASVSAAATDTESLVAPDTTELSVFIVDDDPAMRLLANRILETSGTALRVVGEAADGTNAIEQIVDIKPDVVLCDVMMPSVSGPEVVEAVRLRRPAQQFIFWSATGAPELERYQQEMGVEFVLKDRIEELPAALLEAWGRTTELPQSS